MLVLTQSVWLSSAVPTSGLRADVKSQTSEDAKIGGKKMKMAEIAGRKNRSDPLC
jgi:hypothetical protein